MQWLINMLYALPSSDDAKYTATPPPRNLKTGSIQKTSIRKRSPLFLYRQVTSHRFLFLMKNVGWQAQRDNQATQGIPSCATVFSSGDIFESVHELITQKMLSYYQLRAIHRIFVTENIAKSNWNILGSLLSEQVDHKFNKWLVSVSFQVCRGAGAFIKTEH